MTYTNGYDQGYKKGYDDGYKNKGKSSTGGISLPETLRAIISPDVWRQTLQDGYEAGYTQGCFLRKQKESL